MNYTSVWYYLLVIICLCFYYALKKEYRWYVLLAGSIAFITLVSRSLIRLVLFSATVLAVWYFGTILEKHKERKYLIAGIAVSLIPLVSMRFADFGSMYLNRQFSFLFPIGISFYTMQMIAYLCDIHAGKIMPQQNLLKFTLFVSWFPQIIQGPIPRYDQLGNQLYEGHSYDTDTFMKGIQLIIWGFFLKLMIADKAAVYVNSVFMNAPAYSGIPVIIAGILYSIQLYADFLACTTLSQGVSQLFGIQIMNNFNHPYFSESIKEFWRRWHISFSTWLRDYIYFPLGGSRKGRTRTYLNLFIVFLASGIWHGTGLTFICWGIYHALCQTAGGLTKEYRDHLYLKYGIGETEKHLLKQAGTFVLVMIGWMIFHASSMRSAIKMILSMFTFNLWTLTDGTLIRMGLDMKEWIVLICSIAVLWIAECIQQRIVIRDWFQKQNTFVRWGIYLTAIWVIFLMGTYGYGFNTADFIYGGF